MKRLLFVSALVLLVATTDGWATDVKGLYEARVPVFDRSDPELARGAARALGIVVVKLTGTADATRKPELKGLLSEAKRLIQQFSYEHGLARDGDQTKELLLRVEFDAKALNTELRRRGLVIWGKERPDTLVWLVVDGENGRRLAGTGELPEFAETLTRRAGVRGIPVLLPLGDIEETSRLASAANWQELSETLLQASLRYQTEAALVGYLRQVGPTIWEVQWLLKLQDETLGWKQEGDTPELVIEEGVDSLADAFGRRYADPMFYAGEGQVELTVHGVRSVDDYARVQRYLASLDAVSNLSVKRVEAQTVVFVLATRGGGEKLAQSISFGNVLAPAGAAGDNYELIPH